MEEEYLSPLLMKCFVFLTFPLGKEMMVSLFLLLLLMTLEIALRCCRYSTLPWKLPSNFKLPPCFWPDEDPNAASFWSSWRPPAVLHFFMFLVPAAAPPCKDALGSTFDLDLAAAGRRSLTPSLRMLPDVWQFSDLTPAGITVFT